MPCYEIDIEDLPELLRNIIDSIPLEKDEDLATKRVRQLYILT